jgi:glycine/sarcosine/betaine reductase complex component A
LLRTAREYEQEDVVVVLGATDPEAIRLVGQTVTCGDPTWAGPLAGVALKLPVYHIFEAAVRSAIPGDVYAEKVGHLEVLHDVDQVVSATAEVRASLGAIP